MNGRDLQTCSDLSPRQCDLASGGAFTDNSTFHSLRKIPTTESVRRDPDRHFLINLGKQRGRQFAVGVYAVATEQPLQDIASLSGVQTGPALAPNASIWRCVTCNFKAAARFAHQIIEDTSLGIGCTPDDSIFV